MRGWLACNYALTKQTRPLRQNPFIKRLTKPFHLTAIHFSFLSLLHNTMLIGLFGGNRAVPAHQLRLSYWLTPLKVSVQASGK
jgi:hypothetical protein